jgi:hypothetical protein
MTFEQYQAALENLSEQERKAFGIFHGRCLDKYLHGKRSTCPSPRDSLEQFIDSRTLFQESDPQGWADSIRRMISQDPR